MKNKLIIILGLVLGSLAVAQEISITVDPSTTITSELDEFDFDLEWTFPTYSGDFEYHVYKIEETMSFTNGEAIELTDHVIDWRDYEQEAYYYNNIEYYNYVNPGEYTFHIAIFYDTYDTYNGEYWSTEDVTTNEIDIVIKKPDEPSCEANPASITTNITSGTFEKLASGTIKATNTISGGAYAHYGANTGVELLAGFEVKPGSTFLGDTDGCSGTKSASTELSVNTDMSEITMYPNPADQESTISFGSISGEKQVRVYSTAGVPMNQHSTEQDYCKLDLSNFEKGVYLVNIRTDFGLENRKLIVE